MLNMFSAMYISLCCWYQNLKQEEKGAVDIVAIVVMIGIAVLLAVVFRKQVTNLLNSLFESITETATDAVK